MSFIQERGVWGGDSPPETVMNIREAAIRQVVSARIGRTPILCKDMDGLQIGRMDGCYELCNYDVIGVVFLMDQLLKDRGRC